VHIPGKWADFFTLLLSIPTAFQWAKELLSSPTFSFLAADDPSSSIPFNLPTAAPRLSHQPCTKNIPDSICFEEPNLTPSKGSSLEPTIAIDVTVQEAVENVALSPNKSLDIASPATPLEQLKSKIALTPGPWSSTLLSLAAKGKASENIMDTHTRRRQKGLYKGYKGSPCTNKNCLGCSMDPPTLSPSVIMNLGATFCKIAPSKLTDEELNKSKKASTLGGKKQARKSTKDPNNDGLGKKSKKKAKQ
jgi:hypothetical protein